MSELSEYVGICRNMSEYVGMCRNMSEWSSEYVGKCRKFDDFVGVACGGGPIFLKKGKFSKNMTLSFLIRMYSKYQNVEFVPEQLVGHFEDLD